MDRERVCEQAVLQNVWDYFVVEGGQKSKNEDTCLFRGPGGRKCAVGVLIPDSVYSPDMEEQNEETLKRVGRVYGVPIGFLFALQAAHDKACEEDFKDEIKQNLLDLALEYDLDVSLPEPD